MSRAFWNRSSVVTSTLLTDCWPRFTTNCDGWRLGSWLARGPGQTLQATELVHEAYLRLLGGEASRWDNSAHFFAAAAEAMRRILVDAARRKARVKHGGGRHKYEIDEADAIMMSDTIDLIALGRSSDQD